MQHVRQAADLAQAFAADEGHARRRPALGLAALDPEDALMQVRGAMLAWAVRNLPGTHLELVGGSLVAVRS